MSMFVRKEEVQKLQTLVDELVSKIRNQNIELAKIRDANEELAQELDDSRQAIEQLKETLGTSTKLVEQGAKQINNEVVELKMFLSQIKRDLVNELSSEFSTEMKALTSSFLSDMESFRRLKDKVNGLESEADSMKNEIIKFLAISEKVSQADFDLERYAKVIQQGDKEKLDLLRRIDSLERLVSKLRKSS